MSIGIARITVFMIALTASAWFVLGIRQARDIEAATTIISQPHPLTATQTHAPALLRSAGELNPDSAVDLLRGRLAVTENHRMSAASIFEGVVRREPMNANAWFLLANTAPNAATAVLAAARLARLVPYVSAAG